MAANMWQNSLKNVESDNNKILYEKLLDFFFQRNGTNFLNKPCICNKSILSGIFPDCMKFLVIKPTYKKGGKKKWIQQTIALYHYWLLSRRCLKKPYVLD